MPKLTWGKTRALVLLLAVGAGCVGSTPSFAQAPGARNPAQNVDRWEPAIREFEAQDRLNPPPKNAILFVGASLIRRWPLAEYFPNMPTINRGFGGSQLADLLRYADQIVVPYNPRVIVFFGGDNDLNAGVSPQRVADLFAQIVQKFRTALPQTKLVFIPPRPSLARWGHVEKIRTASRLMKAYADRNNVAFVDISDQIIGEDAKPRPELFVEDGLHYTPEGYRIQTAAVRPHLN
jgi:lysophospholipase L1-like esterase